MTVDDEIRQVNERLLEKRRLLGGSASGSAAQSRSGKPPVAIDEVTPRFKVPKCHASAGIVTLSVAFQNIGKAVNELRVCAGLRGIPTTGPIWQAMTAWEASKPWRALREQLARGRTLGVLVGDVGTGKTALLAHEVLWAPGRSGADPGYFVSAADAFEALSHPFDPERRARFARMMATPMLTLDDLGTEPADVAGLVAFRELAMRRYDGGRVTLVSSNLEPAAVAERYFDDRLRDRFDEGGFSVRFTGKSRRRRSR